jgi:hypothetical protein
VREHVADPCGDDAAGVAEARRGPLAIDPRLVQRRGLTVLVALFSAGGRRAVRSEETPIQHKFGPPGAETIERVRTASIEELNAWTKRILSASTLRDVLD